MKTSLGIWAFGPMVTRFVPGGYQPAACASETTATKVRRAVEGLGGLIDDYEFHYPQELSRGEPRRGARRARRPRHLLRSRPGLHLDPLFGRGGLCVARRRRPRRGARRSAVAAADFAGGLGAHLIIWPGIEGYNYPFQTPYARGWARLVDGIGEAPERCQEHGVELFLEHKNSEPAMKIFMRNIGMTLHVIHKLRAEGIDNVKVNMDWQHLIMNGENLAEYAALLAAEGLLGHQHANSGWGTFDDDNMVGATAFMETLELALELRRAGTARTASGSGSTSTRTRRTRSARSGAPCCSGDFIDAVAGADRRRGAARGAAGEGCRARVRARLRRARAEPRCA